MATLYRNVRNARFVLKTKTYCNTAKIVLKYLRMGAQPILEPYPRQTNLRLFSLLVAIQSMVYSNDKLKMIFINVTNIRVC